MVERCISLSRARLRASGVGFSFISLPAPYRDSTPTKTNRISRALYTLAEESIDGGLREGIWATGAASIRCRLADRGRGRCRGRTGLATRQWGRAARAWWGRGRSGVPPVRRGIFARHGPESCRARSRRDVLPNDRLARSCRARLPCSVTRTWRATVRRRPGAALVRDAAPARSTASSEAARPGTAAVTSRSSSPKLASRRRWSR